MSSIKQDKNLCCSSDFSVSSVSLFSTTHITVDNDLKLYRVIK